jgi:hypothetical protein
MHYCSNIKLIQAVEYVMELLQTTVQNNCHISDAQYAGNYTMCVYLLKMREFFRWENRRPFDRVLSNEDIGAWLTARESLWDEIEDQEFARLLINDIEIDPFETRQVNELINPHGLVYSGGHGLYGKPVFFLAELEHQQQFDEYNLYVASRELARDLAAPPGMAQDKCVFIRRESLRRFIWEKVEESQWYKQETPLARALACYDFDNDRDNSLDKMTDTEINTILLHEIGEIKAGQMLGDDWEAMLAQMPRSQVEMMARAIRDHIADTISTLPELLKNADPAQLHFYFANLSSMRKVIFPSIMQAYQQWVEHNDLSAIKKLLKPAEKHWLELAQAILSLYREQGVNSFAQIDARIRENYL